MFAVKAAGKIERSVIDYLIICDWLKEYLEDMFIDDDRIYVLAKYNKNGNTTKSDHNVMTGKFSIKFHRNQAKSRTEIFNFKNKENQELF